MEKQSIQVISAFCPVINPPQVENSPCAEEDIVDTLIVETYETDSEGNVKPVTKQIETKRYNRKAYIESFSDDVGLTNILEKIGQGAIAEDKYSILNGGKEGQVNDLRGFDNINNLGDIQTLADKARVTFKNLPPELKKNMTFAEFCQKFNNEDLVNYVNGLVTKKTTNVEEGEVNK